MRLLPDGPVDVLMAAYGGGHVTMLRPVAQALMRRGLSVAFLGLTTAQSELERHGVDYFGFSELQGADEPQVQAWGRELAGPEVAESPVPYFESVAYHGLNFRDLVSERGEYAARAQYAAKGRQCFLPIATMEVMLKRLRPSVVVATNSPRAEQALFLAARNLSVSSLCLVDLFALHEINWISQNRYADRICVLNEEVAAFCVARGCNPDLVVATGNPAFDTISTPETRDAGMALRAKQGFGANDKVVLWASNAEPERHPFTGVVGDPVLPRKVEMELRRIVASEPNWHLVVRYHPSEIVDFVPGTRVSNSPRANNIHAVVNSVDAVVVMSSTVGLEAHMAGRPVVSVDQSIFTDDAPYSRMGISTGVAELSTLHVAVANALSRSEVQRRSASGGTASQRVVEEIQDLLARTGL